MFARKPLKVDNKRRRPVRHIRGSQRWAAKELGVNHIHLNLVLNGHRKSRSLTRRYSELMESLEKETTK